MPDLRRLMLHCPKTGALVDTGHASRDGSPPPGAGSVTVVCRECGEGHTAPLAELVPEPDGNREA